jgi:hypothetical protein
MTCIPRIAPLAALAALAALACTASELTPSGQPDLPDVGPGAAGGEDNTFDHPESTIDVWSLIERLRDEGPPTYASRVHACLKVRYDTLGAILRSRGVDLAATAPLSAGRLYREGRAALGAPNYGARIAEATELTTAGASKLFDLLAQAAPEMIAAMPSRPECAVGGVPTEFFDATGACTARGIACLTGAPATAAQLELCDHVVANASDPSKGRAMAVAILAAAAHTCE